VNFALLIAIFASMLAAEIGLDTNVAKRAGLLHDIGKALDHEHEGSHAMAAAKLLRRHGEENEVVNSVEASHEEVPAETPYAPLVLLADAVSAARPGARSDSTEGYLQRVRSLEAIVAGLRGIRDCYALQAGREIRIIVNPDEISDGEAKSLAARVRNKIENELNYPSTIRVTVIRECRFSETAE